MHELSVTENILAVVLSHARRQEVERVLSITLEIGELCDLEPRWLRRYFDRLARGTEAEGAQITVKRIPVRVLCEGCSGSFEVAYRARSRVRCPSCGSALIRVVSGDEFRVKEMEVR